MIIAHVSVKSGIPRFPSPPHIILTESPPVLSPLKKLGAELPELADDRAGGWERRVDFNDPKVDSRPSN